MAKQEIKVPDLGGGEDVHIAEVLVSAGDTIEVDQALVTLESDKASMEVPSTAAGKVAEVKVKVGDSVREGSVLLTLEASDDDDKKSKDDDEDKDKGDEDEEADEEADKEKPKAKEEKPKAKKEEKDADKDEDEADEEAEEEKPKAKKDDEKPKPKKDDEEKPKPKKESDDGEKRLDEPIDEKSFALAYASPAVRRFARRLGVDLGRVQGSGRNGRIVQEDVEAYVQAALAGRRGEAAAGGVSGFTWPEMPEIDFSKFGEIEIEPRSRIRKLSAKNLHRSWLHVVHVTQFDEADVTEMEAFRKERGEDAKRLGIKLTPLAFLLKAAAAALKAFPEVNASLDPSGENLILKKYYHLGVAVDTENGLLVPVIRDVDRKGLYELAKELAEASQRARDGKATPKDFQGGSFTITSLGGIGGTAFTPIVNAPEVAILGVSRSQMKPIYQPESSDFVPRLMLPLSLSYDHRVIDGAMAARFIVHLSGLLADVRRLLL